MQDFDPATRDYAQSIVDFYDNPENANKPIPEPPSLNVLMDYGAISARCVALILDANRLGLPLASLEPTDKSRCQAAALIDTFIGRRRECGEDVAMAEMQLTLRAIFEENK